MLPAGTVDNLLKPEKQGGPLPVCLPTMVAGRWNAADIARLIKEREKSGSETVAGGKLWIMMEGEKIVIKDENGGMAYVTIADVNQRNSVIHVIDHVLLPKM